MLSRLRSYLASLVFLREEEARADGPVRAVFCSPCAWPILLVLMFTPLMPGTFAQRLEIGLPILFFWAWSWLLLRSGKLRRASLIFILGTRCGNRLRGNHAGRRARAGLRGLLVLVVYAAFLVSPAASLFIYLFASCRTGPGPGGRSMACFPLPRRPHPAHPLRQLLHPHALHHSPGAGRHQGLSRSLRAAARGTKRASARKSKSTSDWMWEVDTQGVYTYVSPKVKELLGYEPEELLGRTPYDLMPPEEAGRVRGGGAALSSSKGSPSQHIVNANLHKDGHLVMLDTSGVPVFDEEGVLTGYRGIDRDITEQAAGAGGAAGERGAIPLGFRRGSGRHGDHGGSERHLLRSTARPAGCSVTREAEMLDLTGPGSPPRGGPRKGRPRSSRGWLRAKGAFPTRSFAHRPQAGGGCGLSPAPACYPRPPGVPPRFLVHMRDITARREAEEARREEEQRFRAIVESTRDWIWFCDAKGTHRYSNRAVQDMLG